MSQTPERWWILDPVNHRKHEMENIPESMMFGDVEVPVFQAAPDLALDDWVCDWCNASIPLANENGKAVPVPMERSRAVCPECMARSLRDAGLPVLPTSWGTVHCGCSPCVAFAHVLQTGGMNSWN